MLGQGTRIPARTRGGASIRRPSATRPRSARRCGFEEGRQLQPSAERRHWLVDGEAGDIGGDLEQHPAGLAEIDRAEVVAVALLGRPQAVVARRAAAPSRPGRRHPRPGTRRGGPSRRRDGAQDAAAAAESTTPPTHRRRREARRRALAALSGSRTRRSGRRRSARSSQQQGDAVEAPDGVLRRDVVASTPARASPGGADQGERHPVRIAEGAARSRRRASPAPRAARPSRCSDASSSRRTPRDAERSLLRLADSRRRPGAACSHGKKVRIVPGGPSRRRNRGDRCRDRRS